MAWLNLTWYFKCFSFYFIVHVYVPFVCLVYMWNSEGNLWESFLSTLSIFRVELSCQAWWLVPLPLRAELLHWPHPCLLLLCMRMVAQAGLIHCCPTIVGIEQIVPCSKFSHAFSFQFLRFIFILHVWVLRAWIYVHHVNAGLPVGL